MSGHVHHIWNDVIVDNDPPDGCLSCTISTIKKNPKNTNPASSVTNPRQLLYLDLIPPISKISLTPSTSFASWIIIVDSYSKYASIQGIQNLSTKSVIDALHLYLSLYKDKTTNFSTPTFCFSDIARIKADAGPQFISSEFQKFCAKHHITLRIAPPDHQEVNHGAERPWQTIKLIARTINVHARLDDAFLYHAVQYACDIYNVLPLLGAIHPNGSQSTPFELFYGVKPSISHFRVFGCPCVVKKNTAKFYSPKYNLITYNNKPFTHSQHNVRNKSPQQGIRGIFIGFPKSQQGYSIYIPSIRDIHNSIDVLFDEDFISAINMSWKAFNDSLTL